jgi:ATP-dependent Clp protease ATP-binding subunit ClpC
MGARPLRRAIDEHLLAPLAATLVEHRFPAGEQFLFVRSDRRSIQVEFVDPGADAAESDGAGTTLARGAAAEASLARAVLQPTGTAAERALLHARIGAARTKIDGADFEHARKALEATMNEADFWQQPQRFVVLARYALHDRLRVSVNTAASLDARLQRSVRASQHSRAIAERLALQLHLVELGLADAEAGRVADVVVTVTPALDGAGNRTDSDLWCARILQMYRAWARRRHMQVSEHRLPEGEALVIGGYGAWVTLSGEAGLHVLEQDGTARISARVRVAADEPADPTSAADRTSTLTRLLAGASASNEVVRRYRDGAAPLVRDAHGGWRTGRFDLVLGGDFDLIGASRLA